MLTLCNPKGFPWVVQLVKNPPAMWGLQFDSWVRKFPWKKDRLPTPVFLGFPGGSDSKESACSSGDPGLIPGSGRSPGEGIGYPLQYSWASLVAHLVKKLPAMWGTWVGKIPWRRERLPTPVFWPGEFHGVYSPWGHKESDTTEHPSLLLEMLGSNFTSVLSNLVLWWFHYF